MSRRRYLSTKVSQDAKINRLATTAGDFAALLYTWMIPHAEDDGTLSGDPEELLMTVMPGRRDKNICDIEAALEAMHDLGLVVWTHGADCAHPSVQFPESFYVYQTYITEKRRGVAQDTPPQEPRKEAARSSAQKRTSTPDSAKQRKTAQNSALVKSSFPFKLELKRESASAVQVDADDEQRDAPPDATREPLTLARSPSLNGHHHAEAEAESHKPINPLWDVLVEVFYEPQTKAERSNFGKIVNQLKEIHATPDDVRYRVKQHAKAQNHWDLTPNALVTHWSELANRNGKAVIPHGHGTTEQAVYDSTQDPIHQRQYARLVQRHARQQTSG